MTILCILQGIGDMTLAYQCFRLALANNNDHAEAYNNLGVLELRKGHLDLVSRQCKVVVGEICEVKCPNNSQEVVQNQQYTAIIIVIFCEVKKKVS